LGCNEAIAESGGGVLESSQFFAAQFFLLFAKDFRVEGLAMFEQMPDNACQFVGHGGDGLGGTQP